MTMFRRSLVLSRGPTVQTQVVALEDVTQVQRWGQQERHHASKWDVAAVGLSVPWFEVPHVQPTWSGFYVAICGHLD